MRWWEIVGMEEPSGDTPSVTPVGRASSLREGAGDGGAVPFNVPLGKRSVAGDFHRPYETQDVLRCSVQRAARKAQHCGRFSSPLRNSGCFTFQRSACRPEDATLRAIFIAPTELRMFYVAAFNVPPGNRNIAGDFHRPYEKPLSEGGAGRGNIGIPPVPQPRWI